MSNTDNNKRIAKNTLMLYVRMLVLMGINFYTARVVLNALGVEDYGLYAIVGAVVIFLGFINNSMASASQRFLAFFHGKGDLENLNRTFNSVLLVQCIISVLIFVLGETCGVLYIENYLNVSADKINVAHVVYQFSLFSFLIKTFTVPYNASIIANERMNAFALISIVEGGLQLIAVLLLQLVMHDRLIIYALMMFLVVLITQSCYRIYCVKHFKECRIRKNWDKKTVKNIFNYSGWNLLGAFSSVAIDQGVNMILNSFFGVVVNAARGIAFQVSGAIASLSGNFQQAINPQIVKSYAEGDKEKMHSMIMNGTRFCYYLLLIISIPVLFNMDALLALWLGDVPAYTVTFCRLVLINALLSALSGSLLMGALATGNIKKYQIIVASINLSNLPLSYVVLCFYPNPYLTVYVMILVSIVAFTARLVLTSHMINMSIKKFVIHTIIPSFYTTLVAALVVYFVNEIWSTSSLILLFVKLAVFFIIVLIAVFSIGIHHNERLIIINTVKQKIK